ncbi:MAG: hypothetical protein ACXWKC_13905 [Xanthobacteraceae bacterium]
MKIIVRFLSLAGAIALGGCLPLSQGPSGMSPSGSAMLTPTSQYDLMYGRATPSDEPRRLATPRAPSTGRLLATTVPIPSGNADARGEVQSDANAAIALSDEWWKREKDADTRLRQSTKICRC